MSVVLAVWQRDFHDSSLCFTKQTLIWPLLSSKSLSDSPYRTPISNEILQLQEGGQLHILKRKWWKQRKGGGKCKVSHLCTVYCFFLTLFGKGKKTNISLVRQLFVMVNYSTELASRTSQDLNLSSFLDWDKILTNK